MNKRDIVAGLMISICLAGIISLFASSLPDGLEKVAMDHRFLKKGQGEPSLSSPLPDYVWPGVKDRRLAISLAGVVGTLLVFGFGYGVARLLRQKRSKGVR